MFPEQIAFSRRFLSWIQMSVNVKKLTEALWDIADSGMMGLSVWNLPYSIMKRRYMSVLIYQYNVSKLESRI